MKICDLHTHSVYSDGTLSPAELIDLAVDKGIKAIALCDHNTTDGVAEFLRAAENKDIEAIAGVEFSVDYNGKEVHLIALFVPSSAFPVISAFSRELKATKEKNYIDLISKLNQAGYKLDFESVKSKTVNGNVNRAHIAAELTRLGYTKSIKEAFKNLLSVSAGYYKEPPRPDIFKMLSFIKSIGAVSVLAHPFLNLTEAETENFLPKGKAYGLVGVECYHSEYDDETIKKALALADKYGLKYSGGSDFHGDNKPNIALGTGKGNLKIPYETAQRLK